MKIEVLGTGCPKCMSMEQNVKKAVAELAVQADVEKVTDMAWQPSGDPAVVGRRLRQQNRINPSTDCSTCHR